MKLLIAYSFVFAFTLFGLVPDFANLPGATANSEFRVYSGTQDTKQTAARRAALALDDKGLSDCTARRDQAYAEREKLLKADTPEDDPAWRTVNRKIAIINGTCKKNARTASKVITSICRSRIAALLKKRENLLAAGIKPTDEEMIMTEIELADTRSQCTEKSLQ